jgi:phage-related protein
MATNAITQRIALEGAREIAKQLADLGVTGERAFRQIAAAAQDATSPMGGLQRAILAARQTLSDVGASVGEHFTQIADAAGHMAGRLGLLQAAIAAAGTAGVLFIRSGVRAANEIEDTAVSLGLSTGAYQQLQFAAAAASVEQDKFANAMKFLAKNVTEASTQQTQALIKWQQQLGVVSVGVLDAFNKIGAGADLMRERLAQMGVRVVESGPLVGAFDRQLRALGVRFVDASRNVTDSGEKLSEAGKAIERFNVSVIDASGNIRPLEDVLGDLAEGFKRLGRGPEATALALQIFGRQGIAMLPLLIRGRTGVEELRKAFVDLGLALTETDAAASEEAIGAFARLSVTLESIKIKLATIFAPGLAAIVNAITDAIARNQGALRAWAQDIAGRIKPAIDDFVALLSGKAPTRGGFVDSIVQTLSSLRDSVTGLIGRIVPAFRGLMQLLDHVAAAINRVLGANLSGADVAVIAIVGQISGAFSLLSAVALAAAAALAALLSAFRLLGGPLALAARGLLAVGAALIGLVGLPATIVAGLALLATAMVAFWPQVRAALGALGEGIRNALSPAWDEMVRAFLFAWEGAVSGLSRIWQGIVSLATSGVAVIGQIWNNLQARLGQGWEAIVQAAVTAFDGIVAFVAELPGRIAGALSGLAEIITAPFNDAAGRIQAILQPVADFVRRILDSIASINIPFFGGSTSGGGSGFARGTDRPLRGPGTWTSDSIPAWLSRGEAVLQAPAVAALMRAFGSNVLGLLNNFHRLPQSARLQFSMDGLLDRLALPPIPRFAGGGFIEPHPQAALRPLTLVIDGQRVAGLSANEEAFDRLQRLAALKRVRLAGRRQSAYR